MPRPPLKRRRTNNSQPTRRVANVDSNTGRNELERKLAAKPIGKRPLDSDDSDNLVTKATPIRARRNPRREIYASGAVGKGDTPGAYPTRAQTKQIMTEATNKMLTQSTSTSRANSIASRQSASIELPLIPPAPTNPLEEKQIMASSFGSPVRQSHPSASAMKKVSNTPLPETSILGVIKPRKRQASILQLIDNNDSSSIHSDDEEVFLPDEVSTPLELNAKRNDRTKEHLLSLTKSQLKKRKRDSNIPPASKHSSQSTHDTSQLSTNQQIMSMGARLDLPAPSRTQAKALERQKAMEEDIMALPESSDSDVSSAKIKRPNTKSKPNRQPAALSTDQLRSLMPTKRQKSSQRRKRQDEFEIQEDPSSLQISDISDQEEHSVFLPHKSKKVIKGRQKEKLVKPSNVKAKVAKKVGNVQKSKGKTKSTNTIISTPSTAHLRKPLPLSSKRSGNVEAKSPSQKQDLHSNNILPTAKGKKQQCGGSQQQENDKENHSTRLHAGSSDNPAGEDTVEIQVGRSNDTNVEAKVWNKHWADIDDFSLAFEDASGSAESNSPVTR